MSLIILLLLATFTLPACAADSPTAIVDEGIVAVALTSGRFEGSRREEISAATVETDSVSIAANRLALIWVAESDGTSPSLMLTDSNRTWEKVISAFGGLRRITLFRSMESNNTQGAVSITPVTGSLVWTMMEYRGVDPTGAHGAGAVGATVARTFRDEGSGMSLRGNAILDAGAPTSSVAAAFATHQNASQTVAGPGFVLTGGHPCAMLCVQAEFAKVFSQNVEMSWMKKSHWLVIAAELKKRP